MLQLNCKESKEYRENLSKWHIADFNRADSNYGYNKQIKDWSKAITTDEEVIAKWEDSSVTSKPIMTKDQALADIESKKALIEKARSTRDEIAKQFTDTMKEIEKGVSDTLINAIIDSCNDTHNVELASKVQDEFVAYFKANGYKDVVASDIQGFVLASYSAIRRASDRKMVELHKHNAIESKGKIKKMILASICDYPKMASVLSEKKWTNIIEKRVAKNLAK